MIDKLVVIGTGLIGGSLIRALREAEGVSFVTGCSRSSQTLETALTLGVIDEAETDPVMAVMDADMIVLATPVGAMQEIISQIAPALKPSAIVTDVGSVKGAVLEGVQAELGEIPDWFVPGHPIAGTENSGVEASFASLFTDRQVILTPTEHTDLDKLATVKAMWQATGAVVTTMSVADHDRILAATSHLPHVLAYALVEQLTQMDDAEPVFQFAAGGFRDFSRIASSDPVMWRDICLTNSKEISQLITAYKQALSAVEQAIENKDGEALLRLFTDAKQARDNHFE